MENVILHITLLSENSQMISADKILNANSKNNAVPKNMILAYVDRSPQRKNIDISDVDMSVVGILCQFLAYTDEESYLKAAKGPDKSLEMNKWWENYREKLKIICFIHQWKHEEITWLPPCKMNILRDWKYYMKKNFSVWQTQTEV